MARASSRPSLENFKRAYKDVSMNEKKKDFMFHIVIFAAINSVLIVINLGYTPGLIWFPFPLILWGMALYMHYMFGVYAAEKWIIEKMKKAESKIKSR